MMSDKKILGTPGRIRVIENEFGNFIIDIDETYRGQVSINTVGTLMIGDYQGLPVPQKFGGTGCENQGILSVAGDTVITGSLTLLCNPELQSVLKVPETQGTIALEEQSLQTNNCFSEFDDEQKIKAYDTIAPLRKRGSLTVYDGEKSIELELGKESQFLSPDWSTGLPKYITPEFYSTINNLTKRHKLNFSEKGFIVSDSEKNGGETTVNLDPRLNEFLNPAFKGLYIHKTSYNNSSHFECRRLREGPYIKILYADFVDFDPIIGLDQSFFDTPIITKLGKVTEGEWNAKIIPQKFGGTGCENTGKLSVQQDVKIEAKLEISGKNSTLAICVPSDKRIILQTSDSGFIALRNETLQRHHNLKDIFNPKEAFRHISPTKKKGDIIVRGCGDYDEVLPVSEDDYIHVSNSKSDIGVSYKHPRDITTLNNFINKAIENRIEEAKQRNKEELLQHFQKQEKMYKIIDAICAQFDSLIAKKQVHPVKELVDVITVWAKERLKK